MENSALKSFRACSYSGLLRSLYPIKLACPLRCSQLVKKTLFLLAPLFFLLSLSLVACSEESASVRALSSEQVEGLWELKSVDGHSLNQGDSALLFVLSPSVEEPDTGECSGATIAELDGEELFLVDRSQNCQVDFLKNASAQLAVQDAIYSGVRVEYSENRNQLVHKTLRNELTFSRK